VNEPTTPRKRRPSDDTPRATVFMPKDLLEWIEGIAKREDRSRNYIINRLLQQARTYLESPTLKGKP
jgi:metal-responsive CopG/Arc/MetJ family transcriptional regulator